MAAADRARGVVTSARPGLALACCLGAGFATLLDSVVLSFAVPSMTEALGASTAQVQWLLASYSLTFGLGLVPGGRLGDAFGRRGLFVGGLVVFVVGGLAAAGATDVWWVVGGRVIQGFGAGLISAQVLGVMQDLFAGPRRVRALAAYTGAGAAAALVGPLAAAALLTLLPPGWAWRAVLLLNVPFALTTLVLAPASPARRDPPRHATRPRPPRGRPARCPRRPGHPPGHRPRGARARAGGDRGRGPRAGRPAGLLGTPVLPPGQGAAARPHSSGSPGSWWATASRSSGSVPSSRTAPS